MADLFTRDRPATGQHPLPEAERLAWLRLIRSDGVGPITFYKLLERYGSASDALRALPGLIQKGKGTLKGICPEGAALAELDRLERLGGHLLCAADPDYPLALSAIEDAPPVLSVLGRHRLAQRPCLGMVGARNASVNGCRYAAKLARELGEAGQVIVSGLARGIDTAAHEGALETGTIAVLAGGIDRVFPKENEALYRQIAETGLIVAESPLGMEPLARHFPRRNRIVSGLSAGIVVVEATLRSGSLITARMAAEQGRDVYAVPGHPMDPRAEGPNRLIRDGAVLVRGAEDVLTNLTQFTGGMREAHHAFHWLPGPEDTLPDDTEETGPATQPQDAAERLEASLSRTPVDINDLAHSCGLSAASMQVALLELELTGRAQRLPGNRAVLLPPEA